MSGGPNVTFCYWQPLGLHTEQQPPHVGNKMVPKRSDTHQNSP